MHLVEPGGTCPQPGGCHSCPYRDYCACLRVDLGVTTIDEEFVGDPLFNIVIVDSSTPIEEENGSSEEE